MRADPPHHWAVIPRVLGVRRAAVKGHPARRRTAAAWASGVRCGAQKQLPLRHSALRLPATQCLPAACCAPHLQMPQTSSPAFQVQVATACQCLIFTSNPMALPGCCFCDGPVVPQLSRPPHRKVLQLRADQPLLQLIQRWADLRNLWNGIRDGARASFSRWSAACLAAAGPWCLSAIATI